MPELSIIILSYNVKKLLLECLESIFADPASKNWQVIVVDNASSDGSAEAVKKQYPKTELILSETNLGFSAGNNLGVKKIKSDFALFLNPDTRVVGRAISNTLGYFKSTTAGAITCRVELPSGQIDYSSHRGIPSPWNSLSYFLGLSKMFPKSKLFSGYTASYQGLDTIHVVECISGAFLMVKSSVAEKFGWWDEDYFFNGEDIEFCYQLKLHNQEIIYYPNEKIIHYKGSSYKQDLSAHAQASTNAMRTFFRKHYGSNIFVSAGVWLLEKIRKIKAWLKSQ